MMGIAFLAFIIMDGFVRCNTATSAAPWRGLLFMAVIVTGLVQLYRQRVQLPLPAAILAGVLLSYAISDAVHNVGGAGISTWLLYGFVWFVQSNTLRDWGGDLALAGFGLSVLILTAAVVGPPPAAGGLNGPLNRNMIAGALIALFPAMVHRWGAAVVPLAAGAVLVGGSRGALVALAVQIAVIYWLHALISHRWRAPAGVIASVGVVGLVSIRPMTFQRRFDCLREVFAVWQQSSWFGLGPVWTIPLSWGEFATNAHFALPSLAADTGIVGVALIGLAVGFLARHRLPRSDWQRATMAGILVHGLVDANLSWWPVGIVLALVSV